jgi:roadblock/LC7 domain-containing protein
VDFTRDLEVERWRPIVNWLLAIPQWIVLYALLLVERALALLSFFLVLFTREIPEPILNFRVMTYRYWWRVSSYVAFMRNEYPPFSFATVSEDDGIDPASYSLDPPGEMNRWAPLYKWILAIPHYIVLWFLWIAAIFVVIVAFFAVIFTGSYPQGLRDYLVGVERWYFRVDAYVFFMTDEYPPFSLQ